MRKCSLNDICEFLKLQNDLVLEFSNQFPDSKDFKWLLDFPKSGQLRLVDSIWSFTKHGAGLKFVRSSVGVPIVVDIHKSFGEPNCLDLWRLSQYCQSCGLDANNDYLKDLVQNLIDENELKDLGNGTYQCIKVN
ncbi:DUF6896 domain-containing protein [Rheinheimera fenheensis]|uniref:DUF6896 domain-containing protein n=1 Tax=Rheinheimera fenheensis TaxID=3152295 RepID=UPI0032610981